ncbi:endonuclease/exonuclease/phosphatase family protein [Gaetbulibacter saemankumensis]|uniref:endonuclease/exonuclease/phosphatase family protein n=1 Tax=Gaetbulibacter saemankumensis TaxID=311208 RepID=UPI00041A7483|nr:endonuclease/exonuclease/phosphatase family protein [Gaetbulibacter saemankumensis]
MREFCKFFILLFILQVGLSFGQELKIMSYNVKLDYPKEGENSWANRKAFLVNQIKFYDPDVLGVQEPLPNQMRDMDALLAGYKFVGKGRDTGVDEGEYSAIFYKIDKVELLETETFWLSETPDQVSRGWDAAHNRICTYALFEDKLSKKRFWMFNTHFDHKGDEARRQSAVLLMDKIKDLNKEHLPVILTGDFNMEDTHESIEYILKSLQDAQTTAKLTFGPQGTFNGFFFHEPVTKRIDYIFVSQDVTVNKYAVLSDSKDCYYPSDHLPVFAQISF